MYLLHFCCTFWETAGHTNQFWWMIPHAEIFWDEMAPKTHWKLRISRYDVLAILLSIPHNFLVDIYIPMYSFHVFGFWRVSPHFTPTWSTPKAGLLPKTSAPSSPQLQPAGAASAAAAPAVPPAAVPAASAAAAPAALDGLKAPAAGKSGEEEDEAGCSQS